MDGKISPLIPDTTCADVALSAIQLCCCCYVRSGLFIIAPLPSGSSRRLEWTRVPARYALTASRTISRPSRRSNRLRGDLS